MKIMPGIPLKFTVHWESYDGHMTHIRKSWIKRRLKVFDMKVRQKKSSQEIADKIHVSRQMVDRLYHKALSDIRNERVSVK